MEGETVGIYDATFPDDQQFIMNNISVVWANGLLEVMSLFVVSINFIGHDRFFVKYNIMLQLSLCQGTCVRVQ